MSNAVPIDDHGRVKELREADFELLHINYKNAPRIYDGASPHRHSFYEMFFFESRGIQHEIDFKNFEVEAYSVHFVSPAQVHKLLAGTARGVLFCFNPDFLTRADKKTVAEAWPFYSLHAHQPFLQFSKKEFEDLTEYIRLIEKEYQSGDSLKFEIISGLLKSLLNKLKEKYFSRKDDSNQNTVSVHPYIIKFLSRIETDFIKHLTVQEYAELLYLSPNYLNALCKKELGKSAVSIVQERVLLEAKRLLYSTNKNIKEISAELNFDDAAYFNRFFKKHTGQTPLFFRQKEGQS
jgi:AraC family transcriptional regulator, transcriptional activator of pobA